MSLTLIATRSMPIVSWRPRRCASVELGADAVGAGDEHRLAEPLADLDQRAEAADAGEHLRAHRAPGVGLDALDERVARVDVDAGVAVGERSAGRGAGRHNEVKCSVFALAILLSSA